MSIRYLFFLVITIAAISAGLLLTKSTNKPSSENISQTQPLLSTEKITVIAQNLEVPWGLAFLPDENILVTQRNGQVKLININNNSKTVDIAQITDVKQTGEGGLHGIAIHPNFLTNKSIYLYYTYQNEGSNTLNRVVRYEYENNKLNNPTIIVDRIPGAFFHDGGRIKFGPDNLLYITTGDAQEPSLAQNTNSLAGKILRIRENGASPTDNPFNNQIYSYGHRNPQGITWDDQQRLWSTEHGPSANDELNTVEKGKNYGWPATTGNQRGTNMITPVINSGMDTWAPAGAAYHNGSIFFGGLRGEALFEYKIQNQSLTSHFKSEFGRIREVVLGPDNMLYIATSNRDGRGNPNLEDDKIIRINPRKL